MSRLSGKVIQPYSLFPDKKIKSGVYMCAENRKNDFFFACLEITRKSVG